MRMASMQTVRIRRWRDSSQTDDQRLSASVWAIPPSNLSSTTRFPRMISRAPRFSILRIDDGTSWATKLGYV
jgi:hypothetical protein